MQGVPPLSSRPLLIGTRGSPLALWQARHVAARLSRRSWPRRGRDRRSRSSPPRATASPTSPCATSAGRGCSPRRSTRRFSGWVDLAVHSMKDLPSRLPEGLIVGGASRADVRDAFISAKADSLAVFRPVRSSAPRHCAARRRYGVAGPIFAWSISAAMSRRD